MGMQKKIIVLVDDNVDLARSYQEILLQEGYEAHIAGSGEEALTLLRRLQAPHLILLDCLMPEMSGEEFLSELAVRLPEVSSKAPVVGFSSFFEESPHLDGLRSRVRHMAEKPHDIDAFVDMVKAYCRPD